MTHNVQCIQICFADAKSDSCLDILIPAAGHADWNPTSDPKMSSNEHHAIFLADKLKIYTSDLINDPLNVFPGANKVNFCVFFFFFRELKSSVLPYLMLVPAPRTAKDLPDRLDPQ